LKEKEEKFVINYAFRTKAGSMQGDIPKTNQDSYIIHPNFAGDKNNFFFSVCDGHGRKIQSLN